MLYSIVGMLVIILDQLVKFWVDRNINWTNPTRPILPGILSLVRVQNDGAAFSFLSGSGARVWFIVLTGIFALLVVLALATHFISGKFGRWCLVLVTAGGLSNMIDRVRYGFVLDMFKVELFDFAVFNIADIFITVFCLAFIIYILFGGEKEREDDDDEFDEADYEEEDYPKRAPVKRPRRSDDYEDERPRKPVRSSKKAAPAEDDTDDEDDENMPRRRTNRSAVAAANAYSRRPAPQTTEKPRQQRPVEHTASAQRTQKAPVVRRTSEDSELEKMFETERRPQRPRTAPAAAAQQRRPASAPAKPAAKSPSDNPFAEWEQANAKVRAGSEFKNYTEVPEKKAPVREPVNTSRPSDDFSLDDILNEFK